MYSPLISPGANQSESSAASSQMNTTFSSPSARARSMAITRASGTRSTAKKSTSGARRAVSTVKRPLPQPSSSRTSAAPGSFSRQRPFQAAGSFSCQWAQASIRGSKCFFFRIRIRVSSPVKSALHDTILRKQPQELS